MDSQRNTHWLEDLDSLSLELPQRHANLFFSKGAEDFHKEIQLLKENVPDLDSYEIQVQIAKIVSSIRDAHTSVSLHVNRICPLEYYWFADGLYVLSTIPEYKELQYCKVIRINDIDIDTVIDTLRSIISHENESFLKAQLPRFLPAIELLYGLEIVDEIEGVEITFEDRNKNVKKLEIQSLSIKEGREKLKLMESTTNLALPLYRKNKETCYWFEYIEDFKTVYFKYNSCKNMESEPLYAFNERLLSFIKEKDVKKLVIDLRNNFGGNSTLLDPFIHGLKDCEKINKKGSLFVILGRETFSSALLNLFSLKENTNALFLGEASGGKPNCYGEVERFTLKNSGLVICYSTKYFNVIEDDSLLSFLPDVFMEGTMENYIENQDPALEYALQYTVSM